MRRTSCKHFITVIPSTLSYASCCALASRNTQGLSWTSPARNIDLQSLVLVFLLTSESLATPCIIYLSEPNVVCRTEYWSLEVLQTCNSSWGPTVEASWGGPPLICSPKLIIPRSCNLLTTVITVAVQWYKSVSSLLTYKPANTAASRFSYSLRVFG